LRVRFVFATVPVISLLFLCPACGSDGASEFASVDATRIVLGEPEVIDEGHNVPCEIGFSPDNSQLIYPELNAKPASLIIRDLSSLKVSETIDFSRFGARLTNKTKVAWSPDRTRLAAYGGGRGLAILDLDSGGSTDVSTAGGPRSCGRILWPEEGYLVVVSSTFTQINTRARKLSLDTLRWSGIPQEQFSPEQESTHPLTYLQHGRGGRDFFVVNRDQSFRRLLVRTDSSARTAYAVSTDLRFLTMCRSRGRPGLAGRRELELYRLSVRDKPRLEFRVAIDRNRDFEKRQREKLEKAEASGLEVFGEVYGPRVNPLNGKVIGPDTSDYKGRVRFVEWLPGGKGAIVRTVYEESVVEKGHVVGSVHTSSLAKRAGELPWRSGNYMKIDGTDFWFVLDD